MSNLAQQSSSHKPSPEPSFVEATAAAKSPHSTADHLADGVIFLGMAVAAYLLDWKAADFVWSLWIASLSVGYFVILYGIASVFRRSAEILAQGKGDADDQKEPRVPSTTSGKVVMGLFLLGFFTAHFGGFHLVHATFLALFMPLNGVNEQAFVEMTFTSPMDSLKFLGGLIAAYWPMILATALTTRRILSEPMSASNIMFVPYKSVMKMHLLIFAFAFSSLVEQNNFFLYVLILAFYFAPTNLRALFGRKAAK